VAPEEVDPGDILDTAEAGGRAIRGGSLRIGGYVAGTLVTLVSVPLLVRHLGVDDFGRYVTVLSLIAIVAGVTDAGLGSVAVREYSALEPARRRAFMRDVLGARVVLTFLGVLVALAFALVAGYGRDMVLGTAVAGAGLVVGVAQATYTVPLLSGLRLGWVTLGDLLRAVVSAALVVAGVLAGAGIVPFLAISLVAAVILMAATVALVHGEVPLLPALHPGRSWRVLRDTLPLAASTAIGTLYFRLTIIVMSLITAAAQTGYFATSYRMIEALAGIPVMLVGVTFPILARAARSDPERLRFATQRVFEIALIGGVWMTLSTALGATFAIHVIGGSEAAPAAGVLRLQALYLTPLFANLTFQTTLLALRMHREMLISAVVALAAVGLLSFALIPSFEAKGAAVAVVVGETILAVVEGVLLWRAHPRLRPALPVVPKVAVALALALAASTLIRAHAVVEVAGATVVYFAVLAVLRGIPPELLSALELRVPRRASRG
jgi:O-antigen/teichoic acid export membrane protein